MQSTPLTLGEADRRAGRQNHFTAIRLLAALGVLISHAWPIALGPGTPEPLGRLLRGADLGTICVYVFFAISGYFIARSFARRGQPGAFLLARAARILPGLLAMLLATVLAGAFLTTAPMIDYLRAAPAYVVDNLSLFGLRGTLPGIFDAAIYGRYINGSLWSLSYEVACYAGVFVLGCVGLLQQPRRLSAILIAATSICLCAGLLTLPVRLERLAELGLPFVIGMAFWTWRGAIALSLPFGLALAGVALLCRPTPLFAPALILALAYAVFLAGYARRSPLAPLARLGDYSYGIYLYAFPIGQFVASRGVTDPLAVIALSLPMVLVCAVLSWHLVESPALSLRRRAPTFALRHGQGY